MAAEVLSQSDRISVDLFEAMPTLGRKFLMAGKGGMNITHSEEAGVFRSRNGTRQPFIAPLLDAFGPDELRE
jgi:predicted flavoprotein YhiN